MPELDLVVQRFCDVVHFSASRGDAEQWTGERPGAVVLGVGEAYRLGRLANEATFGAALETLTNG